MKHVLLSLVLGLAAVAHAQSDPFEGLTVGASLVGQQGWATAQGSDTSGIVVDGARFSPLMGSTQSIRFTGVSSLARIQRKLATAITSGTVNIGYDLNVLANAGTGSNVVARVRFDPTSGDSARQVFQPYTQNGGTIDAYQNGFFDPDGLGGQAYGGYPYVTESNVSYVANHWYRFEFTLDFDNARVVSPKVYDIASGTKVLLATGPTVYFNNDGTAYYREWGALTLGFDQGIVSEGWNLDNFTAQVFPVPEPTSFALMGLSALALVRRRPRGTTRR